MTDHTSQSPSSIPVSEAPAPSFLQRVGWFGALKLALAGVVCLANLAFYSILPIAGLGLLPFLFLGCLLLVTGIADDAGYYS